MRAATPWLLPAALLVAAGLTSFAVQIFSLSGEVEPDDWRQPAEYVLEHIGPDDAVNIQPAWNEDPLPFLTDVGDQILRQRDPLIEDVHHYERVWLLAETANLDDAVERIPFEPAETREFGPVSVVRLDAPDSSPITTELFSALPTAKVERIDGDDVRACNNWHKEDRAWYCGKPDKWLFVGEEFLFLGDDPHRCVWAHPLPHGNPHRVTFEDVELGQRLRVRAGLAERAARSKRGTDVTVRVEVGDELEEQWTLPARETSWAPVDIDTSSLDAQTRNVVLEVSSPSVHDRFFCFNGWVFDQ